jgi:hypothetical protein
MVHVNLNVSLGLTATNNDRRKTDTSNSKNGPAIIDVDASGDDGYTRT